MNEKEVKNYDYVSVTESKNGYPSHVHTVTTGFVSFDEADEYAKENGGKVVLLHRKDGWSLWEVERPLFSAPERSAEDEGDDYEIFTEDNKDELSDRLIEEINDENHGIESIDKLRDILDKYEKISDEIDVLDDDEGVLVRDGEFDTIKLHPSEWHDTDVNEYMIGVEE